MTDDEAHGVLRLTRVYSPAQLREAYRDRDAPQIVHDVVARYERLTHLSRPPHGEASIPFDPWAQLRAFMRIVVKHPRVRVLLVRRLRTTPATSQHLLRQLQKCAGVAVESETRAYARSILADAGYSWALNASTAVS